VVPGTVVVTTTEVVPAPIVAVKSFKAPALLVNCTVQVKTVLEVDVHATLVSWTIPFGIPSRAASIKVAAEVPARSIGPMVEVVQDSP